MTSPWIPLQFHSWVWWCHDDLALWSKCWI